MKKLFLIIILIFMPYQSFAAEPIQNGISYADFNGDGVQETIVKTWRGNSNAHGYSVISIYMGKKVLKIVPVDEQDVSKTIEGAECVLKDYRIIQKDKVDVLVSAEREFGKSYADSMPVVFKVYRLVDNNEKIPGFSDWYFEVDKTVKTKNSFCDVGEAFEAEFQKNIK